MAHPNETLLRGAYEEFIKGGIGSVIHLFDDDIVWRVAGHHPLSGDHKGKYGVSAFFRDLMDRSNGTFELEIIDVIAGDRHGVGLVRERARRNGNLYEVDAVQVWTIRDGLFTEFQHYVPDGRADDEFWG